MSQFSMVYRHITNKQVTSSRQVAQVFQDLLLLEDLIDRDKEHFYVMHLDIRSRIKMVELVSIGTLTSSLVHPRETFRRAVMQGSASIIVAHNHLSVPKTHRNRTPAGWRPRHHAARHS
jgi:DNA repair protein RadC